jgi:hypothetical protein
MRARARSRKEYAVQISFANGSLASLAELGRRREQLTTADVQTFLPIDAMSSEEIARAISYLEDQGIEIMVDPDLLFPRPRSVSQLRIDEAGTADPMRAAESETPDRTAGVAPTRDLQKNRPVADSKHSPSCWLD